MSEWSPAPSPDTQKVRKQLLRTAKTRIESVKVFFRGQWIAKTVKIKTIEKLGHSNSPTVILPKEERQRLNRWK